MANLKSLSRIKIYIWILFLTTSVFSSGQDMEWAYANHNSSIGTGFDRMTLDPFGNSFILYSNGAIAKYDPNGIFEWGRFVPPYDTFYTKMGHAMENGDIVYSSNFYCPDISADVDGSSGSYFLDAHPNSTGVGLSCHYLVCYNSFGDFKWAQSVSDNVYGITNDNNGNTVVMLRNPSGSHINLIKYDPNGALIFDYTYSTGVISLVSRNIETDVFGNTIILFDSPWYSSLSVMSIANNGTLNWQKNFSTANWSSSNDPEGRDLKCLSDGSIVFGGILDDPTSFPPYTMNSGSFICKLLPSGDVSWVHHVGSPLADLHCIAVDEFDNIYLGGSFPGTLDCNFGSGINNLVSAEPYATSDGFLIKIDSASNFIWSRKFGKNFNNQSGGLYDGLIDIQYADGFVYSLARLNDSLALDEYGLIGDTIYTPGGYNNSQFRFKMAQDSCSQLAITVDSIANTSCLGPGFIGVNAVGGIPPFSYDWGSLSSIDTNNVAISQSGFFDLTVSDALNCQTSTSFFIDGPVTLSGWDLNSHLVAYNFRPGFNTTAILDVFNEGCFPVNGSIRVVLPSLVNFNSATPPPDYIAGDTLFWNISNLTYDSAHFISYLDLTTSTSATFGNVICFDLQVDPIIGDVDTLNNIKQFCYEIVNGYDPNDKAVHPLGECIPRYVETNELLTYTIRFQNTGNSEAINIHIDDYLDPDLNRSTLSIITSSHSMHTEVLDSNGLRFVFNDIQLPDSSSNPLGSIGYVAFQIEPNSGLNFGTELKNSSEIYFDYNAPIVTNEVMNTISDGSHGSSLVLIETALCDSILWNNNYYDSSGVYSFVTANSYGCDSTIILNLIIYEKTDTTINALGMDSLSVNGTTYYTTGTYFQTLLNNAGCDSIIEINVSLNYTGLENLSYEKVNIYPVPTDDDVNIQFDAPHKDVELILYSSLGKLIDSSNYKNTSHIQYRLPEESGVYLLHLILSESIMHMKIIKK